jgi:hypothetical protein
LGERLLGKHREFLVCRELAVKVKFRSDIPLERLKSDLPSHDAEVRKDLAFNSTLEDRVDERAVQMLRSQSQVGLKDLPDVHSARNSERVQNYINRRSIGQVRHILDRKDLGNNSLVSVASRHLVAFHHLSLLGDVAANELVNACRQFVSGLSLKLSIAAVADQPLGLLRVVEDRSAARAPVFEP